MINSVWKQGGANLNYYFKDTIDGNLIAGGVDIIFNDDENRWIVDFWGVESYLNDPYSSIHTKYSSELETAIKNVDSFLLKIESMKVFL